MATTKPVRILAVGFGELPPELLALREEGHTVAVPIFTDDDKWYNDPLDTYDLILGPKCWRISPQHMKFLPLAIKEARAAQPKRKKKE